MDWDRLEMIVRLAASDSLLRPASGDVVWLCEQLRILEAERVRCLQGFREERLLSKDAQLEANRWRKWVRETVDEVRSLADDSEEAERDEVIARINAMAEHFEALFKVPEKVKP